MASKAAPSHPADSPHLTVVNVLGVSYTGTTWCSLLLGAGPTTFCVGEFDRVRKINRAHCTLHGERCELWRRFDLQSQENVFHQISRLTGQRVLVLTNSKRFRRDQRHPSIRRAYVLLVRDGRSFVASARRKLADRSTAALAWEWARETRKRYLRMVTDLRARSVVVHHEQLQKAPETQLRRICAAIDIPFNDAMLDYTHAAPHYIGGNSGTLSVLARKHGLGTLYAQRHDKTIWPLDLSQDRHVIQDSGETVVVDHSAYRHPRDDDGRVHLDRWKRELSTSDLRTFNIVGGWLNRSLGYRRDPT